MSKHRYKFKEGDIVRCLDNETFSRWNAEICGYEMRGLFDTLFIVKQIPDAWWADGSHYYHCCSIEIEECQSWLIKESMMRLVEGA